MDGLKYDLMTIRSGFHFWATCRRDDQGMVRTIDFLPVARQSIDSA